MTETTERLRDRLDTILASCLSRNRFSPGDAINIADCFNAIAGGVRSAEADARTSPPSSPPVTEEDVPRRNDMPRWTPAERAIYDATQAVEAAGAHPLLTDAVILLDQAQRKVADFVDGTTPPPATETQEGA